MNKVRKVFNEIKKIVCENDNIYDYETLCLRHCKLADKDHKKSKRQYMHVFCSNYYNDPICYAEAVNNLPLKHIRGLIWHEIGHIIADDEMLKSTEKQADRMIKKYFGIEIKYKDTPYGKNLQYVD